MSHLMRSIAAAGLVALTVTPAVAQQQQQDSPLPRTELSASLDARFKLIDANGDGSFDKAEFLSARARAEQQELASIKARLTAEFNDLDSNKDRGVTAAEVAAKVKSAGDGKAAVARIDTNKDGKISLVEYTGQVNKVEATANPDQQISSWDADRNGKVSLQEYKGSALARFDAMDGNGDGVLTIQEAQAKARAAATAPQGR